MHECITRDPLILSGPGIPAGRVFDAMVELIDVFPTLLDLAGIEVEHDHHGRSLRGLLDGTDHEHREYAFTEGGFRIEEEPRIERSGFPYHLKSGLAHDHPELAGHLRATVSTGASCVYQPESDTPWRL
jgi:arylsulfatase A-like enzyme